MKIISPIDGDMLHGRDGITIGEALQITVVVSADPVSEIWVGDVRARYLHGVFMADLPLKGYENTIGVRDDKTGERVEIVVYRVKEFVGGYRLSIDDNIWFLRDIHNNAGKYRSIFDNPYLGFLKKVNDRYGTKVHLNLFYQTEGFDLSQLSDEFSAEWKAQAGWLRLSFHA